MTVATPSLAVAPLWLHGDLALDWQVRVRRHHHAIDHEPKRIDDHVADQIWTRVASLAVVLNLKNAACALDDIRDRRPRDHRHGPGDDRFIPDYFQTIVLHMEGDVSKPE